MKRILFAALSAAALAACTGNKAIILYYSQTGATEILAMELQKQVGADIERFDVADAYSGDYMSTIERVKGERESGYVPSLVPIKADLSGYDVIYLAYPVWFGTYAPPVKALLDAYSLDGKRIIPVCTFGSGGLESSSSDLARALPQSTIEEGFGIRNARIQRAGEELDRYLVEHGYKAGHVDPLPDYSEMRAPVPEELEVYEEATSGYPYPMGEALCVCSRSVAGGVDYIFSVVSSLPDGRTAQGKVFVSAREGQKTEFTKVIR